VKHSRKNKEYGGSSYVNMAGRSSCKECRSNSYSRARKTEGITATKVAGGQQSLYEHGRIEEWITKECGSGHM
jgi:hypothetical protein